MRRLVRGMWSLLLCACLWGFFLPATPATMHAEPGGWQSSGWQSSSGLAAPSSMPLQDYERNEIFPWLLRRAYADLGWAIDKGIRDTGPFVDQVYFGTHPAVRIYYSPEVMAWLEGGREGEVADGGVIVKEMFPPPAALYAQLERHPYLRDNPDQYEALLEQLSEGWAVFIKDRGGDSVDGWFYTGPGSKGADQSLEAWLQANDDDYTHVLYSGFALGTCARCHASAAQESTFADLRNIEGFHPDEDPLQFRSDDSWRDREYLGSTYTTIETFLTEAGDPDVQTLLDLLDIAPTQRPFRLEETALIEQLRARSPELDALLEENPELADFDGHHTPFEQVDVEGQEHLDTANAVFLETYSSFGSGVPQDRVRPFPPQFADHVYPNPDEDKDGIHSRDQFITSDNCMGCHGGLGGLPSTGFGYQVNMFLQTGPQYGEGYNISEYGEWRWSPMGLAGRDPIFHAQLESELILLTKNANKLPGVPPDRANPLNGTLRDNKVALIDTCLSCHGAMGQRQLAIDAEMHRTLPSGQPLNRDFDPDFFYLAAPLTQAEADNPPKPRSASGNTEPNPVYPYASARDYADYHRYGSLAREGISCAVCHHITGPATTPAGQEGLAEFLDWARSQDDWLPANGDLESDTFVYFLAENTTGQFERSPADQLEGPFDDVTEVPMRNALGIVPQGNPFTSESEMCGTCHTINLPNIGETQDPYPVLTAIENNPAFQGYSHSIEQATYLEWLNSKYGRLPYTGDEEDSSDFQSCQDCHMPNRFRSLDGSIDVEPLTARIASIQDSTYPEAENAIPVEDMEVPRREDYRRHEFVGLNAFLIEMTRQFPDILGVSSDDYETGANNGPDLAIENIELSIQEERVVKLDVGAPVDDGSHLTTEVTLRNQTGHRFPSGVAFRRAFVEFAVLDADDKVLWISGRANGAGVLVDPDTDQPLPTEFLDHVAPGNRIASYQPNYQVITRQDQVQIYEELILDANDEFTTSFIHRVSHVKDNRLPPDGWVPAAVFAEVDPGTGVPARGEVMLQFMEATQPEGPSVVGGAPLIGPQPLDNDGTPDQRVYAPDPDYTGQRSDGSDSLSYRIPLDDIDGTPARVRVTVYSQAFMPAWFHHRFELAAQAKAAGLTTPETDRLYYIASHLNLEGTAIEGWKLPVARRSVALSPSR